MIPAFPSDKGDFMTEFTQSLKHSHNPRIETTTSWIRKTFVDYQYSEFLSCGIALVITRRLARYMSHQ